MKNKYLFKAGGASAVEPGPAEDEGGEGGVQPVGDNVVLHPRTGEPIFPPVGKIVAVDAEGVAQLDDEGNVIFEDDPNAAVENPPPQEANPQPQEADPPAPVEMTPEEKKQHRDYELYLTMCKSLTLQLPFERDRVISSKWVKKIETSEDEIAKRLNYVKLLCITTFQHRLAGPFKFIPNEGPLDDLGDMTTEKLINVMANESVSIQTPYYVELSGDLKEYAAYQEIPDFGAHFYYAFSNETILNWHNEKRAIVPTGGLNYPILNPPLRHITSDRYTFRELYAKYSKPTPRSIITPDLLPTLVPEIHKRKVVMKEEIKRMGTKKLISEQCKCGPDAKPDLIEHSLPGSDGKCPRPSRAVIGRPASCIARKAACAAAEHSDEDSLDFEMFK